MCCAAAGDGASALHAVCVSVCFSFYSCWPTIIVVSSRRRRYSQIIIIVIILPVPNFVCDTPLITEAGRSKKYSKIPNWKKKNKYHNQSVLRPRIFARCAPSGFLRFDTFIHRARVYNIKYAIIIIIKSDAAVSSENAINVYDSTAVQ